MRHKDNILLSRDEFRNAVFERDNNKCVVCGSPAVDAHHIIDRSLFIMYDEKGGYFIDNGVSLCADHHLLAEDTRISCKELRELAKIENIVYPKTLGLTEFVTDYDKWGNPILKNGHRLKGYQFVKREKILSHVIKEFDKPYEMIVDKYPRTYHLQCSPGTTSDDRISKNINKLYSEPVIITEKLDGENQSISYAGLFARSRTAPTKNPWSQWLKARWELIKNDLKDFDLEICGENMYGEHSIIYSGLKEHFYVFGMRNTKHDVFLSWDETCYYAELFDFPMVPILYSGSLNEQPIEWYVNKFMNEPSHLSRNDIWETPKEGFVARIASEFPNDMFYNSVFKYVRAKHVKTDQHWAKNWRRARLEQELDILDRSKLVEKYTHHINAGLIGEITRR